MTFAEAVQQPSWLRWLDDLQPYLPEGVPAWAAALAAGGLILLVLVMLLRGLGRLLFGRRKTPNDWDRERDIDLDSCPLPTSPPGDRRLTVYHLPVRLRLVVLAGAGREGEIDVLAVEKLLDRVLPGLGAVVANDRPLIRVWPAQVSHHGFAASFHRHTPKAAQRGELSRWVLVAGRAPLGRQGVLVGLGLWADEPNTLDRLTLDGHQWFDVLRLKETT